MASIRVADIITNGGLLCFPTEPAGFDPVTVRDEDLISHGLPPRPDERTQTSLFAMWQRLVARPLRFVPSSTTIVNKSTVCPISVSSKYVPSAIDQKSEDWSGAVLEKLEPGEKIESVCGTWIVPQLYPPQNQTSKSFDFGLWVGIDGYTQGDATLLQAGTVHTCTINPDGTVTKAFFAFYNWYGDNFTRIDNFPISPGDTITVFMSCFTFSEVEEAHSDLANTTWAWLVYVNESAGSYTVRFVQFPTDAEAKTGSSFRADTAEWILDNKDLQYKLAAFGSAVMFNCFTVISNGQERTIVDSELISMVRNDNCVSQPRKIGEEALGLSYQGT